MAVRVMVEVKAKPGTGDNVVAFFRSIMQDTRAYEGCSSVDVLQNSDDGDNVVLVEVWNSHDQYEKYLTWQRGRGTTDRLMELVAGAPSIRRFNVADA